MRGSGGETVWRRMTGREPEEVGSRPGRKVRLVDELCLERRSTGSAVVTPERGGEGEGGPHRLSTGKAGIAIVHGLNLASPVAPHTAARWHLTVRLPVLFSHSMKRYRLIGRDGLESSSATPGTLGGHRRSKIYGRLDCPSALRWIERGRYVRHRVFFADEETAIAAGYRPCASCLPERYRSWKRSQAVLWPSTASNRLDPS